MHIVIEVVRITFAVNSFIGLAQCCASSGRLAVSNVYNQILLNTKIVSCALQRGLLFKYSRYSAANANSCN